VAKGLKQFTLYAPEVLPISFGYLPHHLAVQYTTLPRED
jgi:hypothetical protein